jgi:hypothetical protein
MTVKKRHVFYISGFDPRGASFYRRLYLTEAQKQAAVGGLSLQIGERKRVNSFSSSWEIESTVEDQTVNTTYEFLQWDDIIRAHWGRNEIGIWFDYIKAVCVYTKRGTVKRTFQASLSPFITFIFPLLILLIFLSLMLSCILVVPQIAATLGITKWLGWGLALVGAIGVLHVGRVIVNRYSSYWLLRIYTFSVKQGLGKLDDLETRLNQFAEHIMTKSNSEADEILIVGHSTGSIMATYVLGRILALNPTWLRDSTSSLSLLTLAQCIPIVSMLPEAKSYRDHLVTLNQSESVDWIDFTAPSDGACFAFVDPLTVSDLAQSDPQEPKPKLLSPRFARLFSPQVYKKMKRDWYRHHFQYIMSSERADEYDYFAITAGVLTLKDRYQLHPSIQNYQRPRFT